MHWSCDITSSWALLKVTGIRPFWPALKVPHPAKSPNAPCNTGIFFGGNAANFKMSDTDTTLGSWKKISTIMFKIEQLLIIYQRRSKTKDIKIYNNEIDYSFIYYC